MYPHLGCGSLLTSSHSCSVWCRSLQAALQNPSQQRGHSWPASCRGTGGMIIMVSTPAPAPGPGGDTRSRSQVQSAQTGPAAAPCPPAPPATILKTTYPGHILDNLTWPPCISCSARSPLPAPCTVTRLARGVARPRVSSAHWAASSLSSSMCPGPVFVSPESTVHMSRQNTSDSTLSHPELSP